MAELTKIPLYLFFIVIVPASADSSTILDQLAPRPFGRVRVRVSPPLVMGPSPSWDRDSTPTLSFFMHDILGGSHPSARVVTGITPKPDTTGLPFSKPNKNIFPLPGGVPLISSNNHVSGVLGNGGNKNNQPFVTAGATQLQHPKFGSLTTIDDELTEGEELGSAVIGRAQGFYLASSLDGTSQTIAMTVILLNEHEDDEDHQQRHKVHMQDTISFFGVHRRVSPESLIAVVGGTGEYEKAGGFATIESLHRRENQHITDGADRIVHFNVYLYKSK